MFVFLDSLPFLRKVITIKFHSDVSGNKANLAAWEATKYEGKTIEFAANFTKSDQISNYAELDELHLKIDFPEIFISIESGLSIDGQLSFKLPIRP